MFHQVFVAPDDCGALCYLWWPNGDLSRGPKTYQMLVHIFGAKSSPSVAGYVLRKTAKDNEKDFSQEAVDAVLKDFYVDDLLKSFADSERAVQVSKQLQELLVRGGFELTKWISNSRSVLSVFPVEERAPTIKSLEGSRPRRLENWKGGTVVQNSCGEKLKIGPRSLQRNWETS